MSASLFHLSVFNFIGNIIQLVEFVVTVDGISVLENERDGFAWLQEREKPRRLTVIGAPYRGPRIVDS